MKYIIFFLLIFSFFLNESHWAFYKTIEWNKYTFLNLNSFDIKLQNIFKTWWGAFFYTKNSNIDIKCIDNLCSAYLNNKNYSWENFDIYIKFKNIDKIFSKNNFLQTKSPKSFNISWSIELKRIQKRNLSCEISATSDIISHLNKNEVDEFDLSEILTTDWNKLPYINKDWLRIWWNPNKWFVWYIDNEPNWKEAWQHSLNWYWVLEKPIIDIYKKYWFQTEFIKESDDFLYSKEKHLEKLNISLLEWNMVQLWWDRCTTSNNHLSDNYCKNLNNPARNLIWYYEEDWKLIKHEWLSWEHAFYLLWYKWDIKNPTDVIVWDTNTWEQVIPINEWYRKWWRMQNRSIIIYK